MEAPVLDASSSAEDAAAWREVSFLLLQAVAENAVHCGAETAGSLQKLIGDSLETLRRPEGASQVFTTAGALSQAISHYSRQTQKQVDGLLRDFDGVWREIFAHLEAVHPQDERKPHLAAIRKAWEFALGTGAFGDLRQALPELLGELARLAGEARRVAEERFAKAELQAAAGAKPSLWAKPAPSGAGLPVDLCTGLPVRAEAEAALRLAVEQGTHAYAAIFYLHRMSLTNARFGEAIGNQVILFCSQHLATLVNRGADALFRWSGPAFVALLDRQDSESMVAAEVQRLLTTPLSRFFETSTRSVYLPLKITGAVVALQNTALPAVLAKLEEFLHASGQAGLD